MNYSFNKFEELLFDLKTKNKKNIINNINKNRQSIQAYLGANGELKTIEYFVYLIKNIILSTENNFKIIKKVLNHEVFKNVLEVFRNSDILINACKTKNKLAIKWLLTMKINYCVQDENGKTALMYAAQDPKLSFAVKQFILDKDCVNISDDNGNNALFYAVNNKQSFKAILNSNIDLNHLNNNNESILLFCCKNKHYDLIKYLIKKKNINAEIVDKNEKTAIMYLVEEGRYSEIKLLSLMNCNINYVNKYNESALSLLISNLYSYENVKHCSQYFKTIVELVELGCDFNIPIDEEGNTAIMIFIMIQDYSSLFYVLKYCKDLNLSIKNKYGEDACSLFFKYPNHCQHEIYIEYPNNHYIKIDDTDDDNIKMLIISYLAQYQNEESFSFMDEEIQSFINSSTYDSCYSDFDIINLLKPEADKVYNKKIKKMKTKDHSDYFSILFVIGLIVTFTILSI